VRLSLARNKAKKLENKTPRFHFIAIGGAVMHNLALELQAHGYEVTGSDDEIFDPAKSRLQAAGLLPEKQGWFEEKIHSELDGIILGMHARADNPELIKAKELGLKIYSFPEFIYHHSRNKKRVVIGGSHGKTTSTAMLMHVLRECNVNFDYLVGSQLSGFDRMVKLSDAPLIVIEGDEYLTSALNPIPKFHLYKPHLAMLTGIAWDHINVFPTFDNYLQQFKIFLNSIEPEGKCFWYGGDTELNTMLTEHTVTNRSYTEPEFRGDDQGAVVRLGEKEYQLSVFGRHNLQNAAGVALIAGELGIDEDRFWTAMQSFQGTARRLEKIHDSHNLTVFRDFAHAPSKVKATVQAIREQFSNSYYFIAVFELHTYSSLQPAFLPGYKGTLNLADKALVFIDPHVFELKKMPLPDVLEIQNIIENVRVFNNSEMLFNEVLHSIGSDCKTILLLMSSGSFAGIEWTDLWSKKNKK
jgi:UDP-N-acetylmuramate: L-alanyl-gamma-D-glutamyl-meso-diaminopimelate ligase